MASHFSYLSVDRKAYVEYAEESEEDTADPPFDVVLESYQQQTVLNHSFPHALYIWYTNMMPAWMRYGWWGCAIPAQRELCLKLKRVPVWVKFETEALSEI